MSASDHIAIRFAKEHDCATVLGFIRALAIDREYGRFEWSVLNWNEPSIRFYAGLGAEPMDEWTTYRLTGAPLTALAAARSVPIGA